MKRDFIEISSFDIRPDVQLGRWCNDICGTRGKWNFKKLAEYQVNKTFYFKNNDPRVSYMSSLSSKKEETRKKT